MQSSHLCLNQMGQVKIWNRTKTLPAVNAIRPKDLLSRSFPSKQPSLQYTLILFSWTPPPLVLMNESFRFFSWPRLCEFFLSQALIFVSLKATLQTPIIEPEQVCNEIHVTSYAFLCRTARSLAKIQTFFRAISYHRLGAVQTSDPIRSEAHCFSFVSLCLSV